MSCSESVSFIWSMSISLDIASLSALLDRIFVLPFFGGLMYTVCRSDTRFLTFVHVGSVCPIDMPDEVECLSLSRTHMDAASFIFLYGARSDIGSRMPLCMGRSMHGRLLTWDAIHSEIRLALEGVSRCALAHASA